MAKNRKNHFTMEIEMGMGIVGLLALLRVTKNSMKLMDTLIIPIIVQWTILKKIVKMEKMDLQIGRKLRIVLIEQLLSSLLKGLMYQTVRKLDPRKKIKTTHSTTKNLRKSKVVIFSRKKKAKGKFLRKILKKNFQIMNGLKMSSTLILRTSRVKRLNITLINTLIILLTQKIQKYKNLKILIFLIFL